MWKNNDNFNIAVTLRVRALTFEAEWASGHDVITAEIGR